MESIQKWFVILLKIFNPSCLRTVNLTLFIFMEALLHAAPGGYEPEPDGKRLSGNAVCIVIPVYNSESSIEPLCIALIDTLQTRWSVKIVLVDDASIDRSLDACKRLQARHPSIIEVIELSRNFGEHNAVMAGLNYADGDYCVIMDDDMQNPPTEVSALLEEIGKGFDVVYVRYQEKQHTFFRNLGSRIHNWAATRALGKPKDLYLSSFKVMSRFLVDQVVRYAGPTPYIDAIILRSTRNISVVTSRHAPREEGESGYTFAKLFAVWGNMVITFSMYPLRLLAIVGLVMALAGVAHAIYILAGIFVPTMSAPDSYERLTAVIWFFRGLTLLAISILGEYVGRIYMHLNRTPQFIVRRISRRVDMDAGPGNSNRRCCSAPGLR